jgi:predicted nucleic acid-binding protein
MYVIDSSIYCARFLLEDTNHNHARELIASIEGKILLPYIVFAETNTVLTYKHSKERAHEFTNFILSDDRFVLTYADMTSEIYFWKSIDKKLSYVDIVLSFVAFQNDAELLSFDDDMMKLYKQIRFEIQLDESVESSKNM